ncbi:MAG: hypothetical protein GY940_28415 [bacterium]|nr:hypothetical protein [bacterium]
MSVYLSNDSTILWAKEKNKYKTGDLKNKTDVSITLVIHGVKGMIRIGVEKNDSGPLSNGIAAEKNGIAALSNGIAAEKNGVAALSNGIAAGKNGIAVLTNGIAAEKNGIAVLTNGIAVLQCHWKVLQRHW